MDVKTQQLNILMETIREIVKAKTCPEWVIRKLTNGVKQAKSVSGDTQDEPTYEADPVYKPYTVGETVMSNIPNDRCLYKIMEQVDPINGVNLYTLRIERGDKSNPAGYIVYNVPESSLCHIKDSAAINN